MDISNKTLAFFLVAAIVVSIAGTFISLDKIGRFETGITGYAGSDTGNVTLYVNKTASIIFINATVDWGSGSVDVANGNDNCTMETNTSGWTSEGCDGFQNSTGLELENNGNLDVNLTFNFDSNSTAIGGTGAQQQFKFNVSNNDTSSCQTTFNASVAGTWVDVSNAFVGAETKVCENFTWGASEDSMDVDFLIMIPDDAPGRTVTINLTATAESIEG